VGRSGIGKNRKRPDSFGCIDVLEGNKPRFMVNPFVAKCHKRQWQEYVIAPFVI